jgi:hypothetical protein
MTRRKFTMMTGVAELAGWQVNPLQANAESFSLVLAPSNLGPGVGSSVLITDHEKCPKVALIHRAKWLLQRAGGTPKLSTFTPNPHYANTRTSLSISGSKKVCNEMFKWRSSKLI